MFSKTVMRATQIMELYELHGIGSLFHEFFYRKQCAIAVVKDLRSVEDYKGKTPPDVRVVDVTSAMEKDILGKYSVKHRNLKCDFYLENGYKAVAVTRADHVVGDIWYATNTGSSPKPIHPDMEWLNLVARQKDVYMFDMFLDPKERGNGLAAYLQHNALLLLKKKGFEKAYGYFLADNIPALWVHRILKWKEIKKVYTKRFIRRWVIGEEVLAKSSAKTRQEGG